MRARKATSALELAEDMKVRIRSLADMESRKAREAEAKAEAEKLRANHLQKQVLKLERALREARRDGANGKLTSAIRKIATSSAVGKRLAAALHPDKVPPELSDALPQRSFNSSKAYVTMRSDEREARVCVPRFLRMNWRRTLS